MTVTRFNSPLPQEDAALSKPSESARAFRDISRSILYRGLRLDTGKCYDHLRDLFGLDRLESDLLALLLTRRIGFDNPKQFCRFLPSVSEVDVFAAWYRLLKRDLVANQVVPKTYDYGLMPRPAFRFAIQEDLSLVEAGTILAREEFIKAIVGLLHEKPPKTNPQEQPDVTPSWMRDDEDDPLMPDKAEDKARKDEAEDAAPVIQPSPMEVIDTCLSEYPDTPLVSSVLGLTKDLDRSARMLLFGMMGWFVENFTRTVHGNGFQGKLADAFDKSLPTLLEKGLVVSVYVWNESEKTADSENYRISPRVAEVFRGMEKLFNFGVLAEFGTFTPLQDIRPKELFYPEKDLRGIQRLRRAAAPDEYTRIIASLREVGMRPCLSAILYGAPGTGKTELARQIARESGRGILVVDVPKLFGIYIGEGAIRLRNLFQTYRYVCAVCSVSPILFMDEADGLLSRRVAQVTRSADKDANSCQSIILEELNTLPGMLIATTNLIDTLDEAMLRRFMLRVEFHLPDIHTRAILWEAKVPSLSREEAATLAEGYAISGGLIDNIVSIATMDAILENRPVTAEDLRLYCEEQGFGKTHNTKIGY